jgi:sarcosine oxidase subunit alpha
MLQPNRLAADAAHGWGGRAIDRSRPISFRLDGRSFSGFAGDTLLSALLANGMTSAGTLQGVPVALDAHSPLLLAPRAAPATLLPIDRTPALDGLDLVTAGASAHHGLLGRLLARVGLSRHGSGPRLEPMPQMPWWDLEPSERLEVEALVVGGGIAGLSAANAARGRTLVLERRTELGGDARFYGTVGEETPPDERIASLVAALQAEVLLGAELFSLVDGVARAHQVRVEGGQLRSRVIEIAAQRVVLATGATERLPVFAGNRLPGVSGAIAAYHLAEAFGVWPGRRVLVSTPASEGYRLGLLAADAGLAVQRIADTRLGPNSRFIDFCKASGVSFTSGLLPRAAMPAAKGGSGLVVSFAVAIEDIAQETGPMETDRLIAAGGRQPELSLWLMAGGSAAWRGDRFFADGMLPDITIAGAAAGYRRSDACVASGTAAAKGTPLEIVDELIDPLFETPAAPTTVAPALAGGSPAFLGLGRRMTPRPEDPLGFVPLMGLNLGELAALVQIGALPEAEAGRAAGERVAPGGDILASGWTVGSGDTPGPAIPAYLTGRFGPRSQLWHVTTADARFLTQGSLIFATARATDPAHAIGTILGPAPGNAVGGTALLAREAGAAGARLHVRDAAGTVAIEAMKPL